MNTNNVRSRLGCLAVICAVASVAGAAERAARFAVPDKQIQALGIRVSPLQQQGDAVLASFPAQVMVPPNREQVISSPVAGLVVQILVQQNEAVRQGAPLLRISSAELGQWQLQLLQTNTRATLARQAAQREQKLFDEGIIPQRRVEEANAALKESGAALNQAKAVLRLSGMPAATINRIAVSGKLEDSLVLHAMQAGIVTTIDVKAGQRVDAAVALLHVVQTDSLWLDIQVPATDAANWPPGTQFKLQGRVGSARVTSVGSSVSAGSQTVALRAVVESEVSGLRPGEIVAVELTAAGVRSGWSVPLSAVAHDGKQAYLFVRTPDGFEARPVTVAASAGQQMRVQGSLKAGEQVAVSGVVALKGAWLDEKGGR